MMTFEGFGRNKNSECVYLSASRFSMAWEKGIQVPFPFFVFAWHWKTNLNFAFRFRLTLKNGFALRISFFVFASLWKTDMNFVFRFSFSLYFEKKNDKQNSNLFFNNKHSAKRNSNPFFKVMRKRKSKNEIQIRFSKWSENEKRNTKFKSVFQS